MQPNKSNTLNLFNHSKNATTCKQPQQNLLLPRSTFIKKQINRKSITKKEIYFTLTGVLKEPQTLDELVKDLSILPDDDEALRSKINVNTDEFHPIAGPSSACNSTPASSEGTPNSITDELTNIPSPSDIQKKLLEKSSEKLKVDIPIPAINGQGQPSRKRLLSEKGEEERAFPVIDQRIVFHGWYGCALVTQQLKYGRRSGVGLYNPSNNCFLNSVLQAVVHTAQLARVILNPHFDSRMCQKNGKPCFHCDLRGHIERAIRENHPINANWINKHLSKIFPHHRNGTQEDAHEMLTLLLGALEPLPPKSQQPPNGLRKFDPVSSTPIEQIFGGSLRNQIQCTKCSTVHTNYEKIREINLGLNRSARTPISELIQDFFKVEQIQNFTCKNCKCKCAATRFTSILRSPSVLIVQLKRFNPFGGKNRLSVRSEAFIDLTKYTYNSEPANYRLNGVIEHIGGGLNFGHYISAMRGFDERSWFKFDDSERTLIREYEVLENMEPYILFYTRVTTQSMKNPQPSRQSFSGNVYRPPYTFNHQPQFKHARLSAYGSRPFLSNSFASYTS